MSNNIFKAGDFLFLAITFIIAKIINKSVYSMDLTIFCVIVLVVLAIKNFIKYRKEREEK